jgi:hypothetical protein
VDFSKITDHLYIGTTPYPEDYPVLLEMGVGLVINMRVELPPRRPHLTTPIRILWLPSFDSPLIPISVRFLRKGVRAALETIREGYGVYTYCAAGIHRSAALGASILIGLGYSLEESLNLVKQRRHISDPYTWYIRRRIEHFSRVWDHAAMNNGCTTQ